MYIKKVQIENIRSITEFEMVFRKPAGWHVLIGDNDSGKSTIIRSIALALVGPEEAQGLRANWNTWLNKKYNSGSICLEISSHHLDKRKLKGRPASNEIILNQLEFKKDNGKVIMKARPKAKGGKDPKKYNWGNQKGWFSVSYGPYRRFEGGNRDWDKVYVAQPKLGAHLSAFGEDVALTEALEWLINLQYKSLEFQTNIAKENEPSIIIDKLKQLINSTDFLPHKAEIESISSEGVFFFDGHRARINVNQLSDGYRSILSMSFELVRQMIRIYGFNDVFKSFKKDSQIIDLPGVVLIDEIDAHLHPTWQTKIGHWFTKYFPKIQFIVTTHSPLICRASEKGSIWRLAAPGTETKSGEITGLDKERLIFGNILDAYGTEVFGKSPVRSEKSDLKLERLGKLNMLAALGKINPNEESERVKLQQILSTE